MILQTLGIIKPDAIKRHLENIILKKIKDSGLSVKKILHLRLTKSQAEELYKEHKNKIFYNNLIKYITSSEIIILLIEGENAINSWRNIIQNIRHQYAINKTQNCAHGSDNISSANREINLFFNHKN